MRAASPTAQKCWSLPPHGGSGLKSTTSKRLHHNALSPSTRREWIEIAHPLHALVKAFGSPSTRREWIEIGDPRLQIEGCRSLPPHGGSGLKWLKNGKPELPKGSLPPHGGSGLKYSISPCSPVRCGLPPHGGSGLK